MPVQVTWLGVPGRLEGACGPVRALLISMGLRSPPREPWRRRDSHNEAGQLAREILSGAHDVESPRLARTGSFSSALFGGSVPSSGESASTQGRGLLARAGSASTLGSTLFGGLVRTGSNVPPSRESSVEVFPREFRARERPAAPASPLPKRTGSDPAWTNPRSVKT